MTAAAPAVERESASIGAIIDNRKVVNIPLNARNPYALALLVPGVSPSNKDISRSIVDFGTTGVFSVSGGRPGSSEFLLDGVSNTVNWSEAFNSVPNLPSVDAVQEFKVQTNSYSAEFGRSGGGVVNVALKSGTNSFHGAAYEFLRNSRLDSNDFFANRAGSRLASFKRNQYGATLGGPIVRDKAFFFADYEGLRERSARTMTNTFPTAAQRLGDFRQTFQRVSGNCTQVRIFDPTTTRANPAGGYMRDQFPNNVIPTSRLDAAGLHVLPFYPQPNTAGDACSGANNFFVAKTHQYNIDQADAKFDWSVSSNDRLAVSMSWRGKEQVPPNFYGNAASNQMSREKHPSRGVRLDYTRIQTPSLVLNLKFGINRVREEIPPHTADFHLTELGFPKALEQQMSQPLDFPVVTTTGYGKLGVNYAFAYLAGTTYNWNASATWMRGKHAVKFGVEARALQSSEYTGFSASGNYSFTRGFTQGPDPNAPRADRGDGIASLLLGAGTGSVQVLPSIFTSTQYLALYIQDDIKLSSKLTLNLGLRYDLENGRDERFNQLSWFDFSAPSPLASRVPGMPGLKGGLRFVGTDADRQFDTDKNNFGPRLGLAYSVNPKLVIRTGYGVLYAPFIGAAAGAGAGFAGFQSFTSWLSSLDGLTPLNAFANAFPSGLDLPSGRSLGLLTNVGSSFGETNRDGAIDRTARVGYMQQWNFNVQKELPGNLSLEAAYAGSKGTKLPNGPRGIQVNQLTPEQLRLGTTLQQLVPNPFFGIVSTRGLLSQPTVTRAQLLRPFPQFLDVLNFRPASASSIYHAFQLRLQKQLTRGLTLLVAYTNSKLISDSDNIVSYQGQAPGGQNSYDRRADRSVSALDSSQRMVISYVYELPFGRGKRFASGGPRWASEIASGWQINGITTFSRGLPLAPSAPNNSNSFSDGLRPNVTGNPKLDGGRSTSEKLAQWFDTSKFTQPPAFTFGNASRTLPNVRGDGSRNFDFSLFRQFRIREGRHVELRGEFFNVFNTPQFDLPGVTLGGNNFGAVSAQGNIPRQIQFGLKLVY